MSDPLAQFRRKPIEPVSLLTDKLPDAEGYQAFGAKDKVERLRIRRAMAPTRSPGYAFLLDVTSDGPFGTNFVLVFTFMSVLVRGKNLLPVISALESGRADFIQEFHPDLWAKPTDSSVPLIESIEVVIHDARLADGNVEVAKRPAK